MPDASNRRTLRLAAAALIITAAAAGIFLGLPRFRESAIRSRIETAETRLRAVGSAIEVYYVEHKQYPIPVDAAGRALIRGASDPMAGFLPPSLTTPVSFFIEPIPYRDPFSATAPMTIQYAVLPGRCWLLSVLGPDGKDDVEDYAFVSRGKYACCQERGFFSHWGGVNVKYDPTNGLISPGDLVRTGP